MQNIWNLVLRALVSGTKFRLNTTVHSVLTSNLYFTFHNFSIFTLRKSTDSGSAGSPLPSWLFVVCFWKMFFRSRFFMHHYQPHFNVFNRFVLSYTLLQDSGTGLKGCSNKTNIRLLFDGSECWFQSWGISYQRTSCCSLQSHCLSIAALFSRVTVVTSCCWSGTLHDCVIIAQWTWLMHSI